MSIGFPNLQTSPHHVTSPPDTSYNCVAWALERDQVRWWQPGGAPYFWPIPRTPPSLSVATYLAGFSAVGYKACRSRSLVPGLQKIAIYTQASEFLHVAALLPDKTWTSKLGKNVDISHDSLESLEGGSYGRVTHVMRRRDPTLRGWRATVAGLIGLIDR